MTTNRRQWFSKLGTRLLSFGTLGFTTTWCYGAEATLKEQLEFGLKARRPEEFAWIETVVNMVEQGQLPAKLVTVAFNWSRKQGKYPYQYFVRALRILAKRQGINVPQSG